MKKMIGIFGTGRNGSTLLMRLMDGSPDLWVHPTEMNYLSVFSDLSRFGFVRKKTAYNATTQKPLHLGSPLSAKKLISVFSSHIQAIQAENQGFSAIPTQGDYNHLNTLGAKKRYLSHEFLPLFLEQMRKVYDSRKQPPKNLVFKTIETPYINEYEQIFPEMRFIHIIRNPLSNYSSLKRTNMVKKGWPFWQHGGDEMRMFLEKRWLPHATFLVNEGLSHHDKHFMVSYEYLTQRPQEILHDLYAWLGVIPPIDPTSLTVLGGKAIPDLTSNPSGIGVHMPSRVVPDMAAKFDYDEVLSPQEKEFIMHRTYNLAIALGYSFDEAQTNFWGRLNLVAKWVLPDQWELINVYSKPDIFHRLHRTIFHVVALIRRRFYIFYRLLS